jgi:hypothetical protein
MRFSQLTRTLKLSYYIPHISVSFSPDSPLRHTHTHTHTHTPGSFNIISYPILQKDVLSADVSNTPLSFKLLDSLWKPSLSS